MSKGVSGFLPGSFVRQGVVLLIATWLLAGCVAAPPPAPPPPEEPARTQAELRADAALAQGIASYRDAAWAEAERALLSPELWAGDVPTRVDALKHLAFTYAVTDRPTECRWAFLRALQLDPDFDLGEAERGHPGWGPQFEAVRRWIDGERTDG